MIIERFANKHIKRNVAEEYVGMHDVRCSTRFVSEHKHDVPLASNESGESYIVLIIEHSEDGGCTIHLTRKFPRASSLDLKFSFTQGHDAYDIHRTYALTQQQLQDMLQFFTLCNEAKDYLLCRVTESVMARIELFSMMTYIQKSLIESTAARVHDVGDSNTIYGGGVRLS